MLTQEQDAPSVSSWGFLELWIDPTATPPYVLMLLGNKDDCWCIIDPAKEYQIIFAATSYKEAKLWLLEDEYESVNGRLRNE
jgi:hypothetical protein